MMNSLNLHPAIRLVDFENEKLFLASQTASIFQFERFARQFPAQKFGREYSTVTIQNRSATEHFSFPLHNRQSQTLKEGQSGD